MATYSTRLTVTERFEIIVPTYGSGAVIAEVSKAMSAVDHKCVEWGLRTDTDDYCWVISGDDSIIFCIERELPFEPQMGHEGY